MDSSPRRLGAATLNHLATSDVNSSRNALKSDLMNKIVHDDPNVFRRLHIEKVDDQLVKSCAASFHATNIEDINTLMDVANNASKKTLETLELEEKNDKLNDPNKEQTSGNHGTAEERKMYDPLVRLFGYINNFSKELPSRREFQRTKGMLKPTEGHTKGFTSCSPDLTISVNGSNASKSKLWRHRDAFGEVKPSKKQGPKSALGSAIPSIVTQSADYARLFMSSRPFMLFCVGILIFGTEFCVGIFDRDGISFSPIHDMFKDTEIFIRVVRSLACDLTIDKLGFDPTVHILSDDETKNLGDSRSDGYPSVVVSPVGNDPRRWCTIGPPIWSSMSLLGRGTHVCLVREYVEENGVGHLEGNVMIIKTAWRNSARIPESDIYRSIQVPPKGLAEFECGGDVMFAGFPITVHNLRSAPTYMPLPVNDQPSTPVLHRLLLRSVGRQMWKAASEREMLTGFRDALQAHVDLCDMGILHRDISAGNMLLATNQQAPLKGFLTDLEFAHIESSTITPQVTHKIIVDPLNKYDDQGRILSRTETTIRTHITFGPSIQVKRGAPMSGTAQFMARELLKPPDNIQPFVHEKRHDVESFIWVLSYCVMRFVNDRAFMKTAPKEVQDQAPKFEKLFNTAFGKTTRESIATERQSGSAVFSFIDDFEVAEITKRCMNNALVKLFITLRKMVHQASGYMDAPILLTHDALLTAVNIAIESLPEQHD